MAASILVSNPIAIERDCHRDIHRLMTMPFVPMLNNDNESAPTYPDQEIEDVSLDVCLCRCLIFVIH